MDALPNYFLADLPADAPLTAGLITEACQTLKRNRAQYLERRSTAGMVRLIADVARGWLEPDSPFRRLALEQGPARLALSRATLARGLDDFFAGVTVESMEQLLVQDLGHAKRLDHPVASKEERAGARLSMAVGPELQAHITAGNIPVSALAAMIFGLLMRSSQFVKCATGAALIPRLFAHSIYQADAKVGACMEVATWKGGDERLEQALFAEADCVTATGSDETLADIRRRLSPRTRFVGFGHKLSFGYVSREMLGKETIGDVVVRAGADVTAWNQLGCLSPHVIYVENDGQVGGERFAELLAGELQRLEAREPRGPLDAGTAATIASMRAMYAVRAAHLPDTRHWCSEGSTAWTVVFEKDARFQVSCLNRFIYVKEVANLDDLIQGVDMHHGQVSTVGVGVPEADLPAVVTRLARWGVSRVCPLGQMQKPPLEWRHDGRPPLAELVRWVDVEQAG